MTGHFARALRWAPAAVALVGCGPSLQGSLTTLLDLKYTKVEITSNPPHVPQPDVVNVAFARPQGSGEDIVLAVSVSYDGTQFAPNQSVDLTEIISTGAQRGVISRNVFNDPHRTFPLLRRGDFKMDNGPVEGATINGTFSATFVDGTSWADGFTVYADFQGQVP